MVGFADTGFFTPTQAFHWTEETGIVRLGTLDSKNDNLDSRAFDVSDDGSVIVGDATTENFFLRAVRWTEETGLVSLGTATGDGDDDYSRALGISGDGNVVVGSSTFDTDFGKREDAFRWTEESGFLNLNEGLPGRSIANAVTQAGDVIIGGARNSAFRWTEETGLVDLGTLPGDTHSMATAVSDDGNIVVGMSSTGPIDRSNPLYLFDEENSRAFYWTQENGMQDLTLLLTEAGLDMSETPLVGARGMSPDGEWISAISIEPDEEFPDLFVNQLPVLVSLTATLPEASLLGDYNGNGQVEQSDLDLVLLHWGQSVNTIPDSWVNHRPSDGLIDQAELDGVLLHWGQSAGAYGKAIPEPKTYWLLVGGILALLCQGKMPDTTKTLLLTKHE